MRNSHPLPRANLSLYSAVGDSEYERKRLFMWEQNGEEIKDEEKD